MDISPTPSPPPLPEPGEPVPKELFMRSVIIIAFVLLIIIKIQFI